MRTLLIGSLVIATTTAAAAVLYSTGSSHRLVVKPIAVPDFNYRFHDRFCRAEYNNPTDRNAESYRRHWRRPGSPSSAKAADSILGSFGIASPRS